MNEFEFISKFLKPLASKEEGLNLSDDVALLPSKNFIFTTDTICENIHFLANSDPFELAIKLLSVNISDLIAKGAKPRFYSLNLSLSSKIDQNWLEKFTEGLKFMQEKYNFSLIGGDTTKTNGDLVLSASFFGEYRKFIPINGAQEGDLIWVTGYIGDSFLGLDQLQEQKYTENIKNNYFISCYNKPSLAFDLADKLHGFASASTDISDGLIADLTKITSNSNKGASIYVEKIPFSTNAKEILKNHPNLDQILVNCGDDYQILFTSHPKYKEEILRFHVKQNINITKIGKIDDSKKLKITKNGSFVSISSGYKHSLGRI